MGNRHQNRAEAARKRKHAAGLVKFLEKAKVESVARDTVDFDVHPDGTVTANNPGCDMPGCSKDWVFSTMATINDRRRVVARRCIEHRLG